MGDPQEPNIIIERIDSICEGYIDFFWGILTFKPVRKPVRELLQTSPLTSPLMERGVTAFQGVTDSVMENSVGQWIKDHQKLVKVAVAAAACAAGFASLVSHSTPLIWPVLISAACLPVAEHYRHKAEKNGNLSKADQLRKTVAGVSHVVADAVTIVGSLASALPEAIHSWSVSPFNDAVAAPLADKVADIGLLKLSLYLTKRDTCLWLAAKVTTNVLAAAALHNVVAAVVPMVAGVYLTVYALGGCFKAGQCLLSPNKGARFAATAAAAASVLLGGVVPPSLTPPQLAGPPVPTHVTSPPPTHTVTIPEGGVTIPAGGTLWKAVKNSGTCPEQNPKQDICIANVIKALADNGAGNVNRVYPGETLTVTETKVPETHAGVLVSFRGATAQVHER
jgi:hypothetical protein